ncbi:MAG: desulfoferrodoxin FeS4 iron-binding domain-containing protein [Methanomicrobiales archaeon]|nr:desulfoferrodoxin FeS4 iron-binding domain-containing protein [Methanomicrobiales archaeon]MDD1655146.1 desulfoferrodoxin FeS4 iron-binding domain-containing protein [Methanomicrobiales archaeon]
MTQRYYLVYRCSVCGNMVEVTGVGRGELVCCVVPMILLPEQSQEASHEKHRPPQDPGVLQRARPLEGRVGSPKVP